MLHITRMTNGESPQRTTMVDQVARKAATLVRVMDITFYSGEHKN